MKCDELKAYGMADPAIDDEYEMYKVAEVDEAIAELKAKLESVQASAYADSVDAGMRERRLRRALCLLRDENARMNFEYLKRVCPGCVSEEELKNVLNFWEKVRKYWQKKVEAYK